MNTDSGQSVSVWMATAEVPTHMPLAKNARADVCIIRAGIAGMTTAYVLAGEGKSVIVLDDGPIAGGETCRTTAHLVNALDDRYYELECLHGERGARLAAESHTAAIDKIEEIVNEEHIDCDFERLDGNIGNAVRWFWLNKDSDARAAIERRGRKEKAMSPKAPKKQSKSPKAPKKPKKPSKAMSVPRRAQKAMSHEARAIYAEIQQGVRHLENSIGEIQQDLRKAEHKLEADARARIRELRKDARTHLSVLKEKRREAAGTLKRVSAAAGGPWEDIKRSVDSVLADIRATATAAVKRFRSALGG